MIGNRREYDVMAAVESDHWWYAHLHRRVLRAIEHHCVTTGALTTKNQSMTDPPTVRILDAGCGTGGLLMKLQQAGFTGARGFDLSEDAVAYATERGLDVVQGDLKQMAMFAPSDSVDVIVNNDTLYHLNELEQRAFFKACYAQLKPGGIMVLNVPALKAFSGNHDLAVGITQRFSKRTLLPLLEQADFQVLKAQYWPFILSPLIGLTRLLQKIQRKTPGLGHDQALKQTYQSDLAMPHPFVNAVLSLICRFELTWPFKTPWGSSLFVVLQKRR